MVLSLRSYGTVLKEKILLIISGAKLYQTLNISHASICTLHCYIVTDYLSLKIQKKYINDFKIALKVLHKQKSNHFIVQVCHSNRFDLVRENSGIYNCIINVSRNICACRALFTQFYFIEGQKNYQKSKENMSLEIYF